MRLVFQDRKLAWICSDERRMVKRFGQAQSKKIIMRLNQLQYAPNPESLKHMPGRFHQLVANRNGQWACSLNGPWRMIFEVIDGSDQSVHIIEIINYHDS